VSRTKSSVPGEGQSSYLSDLLHRATAIHQAGNYEQASQAFAQGFASATARGQTDLAGRFLWGIGNCDFARHRYQPAIESYLAARKMFESIGATSRISSINGSLASVFLQLGAYDEAIDAATRALAGAPVADPFGQRVRKLVLLAELQAIEGKWDQAQALFVEAIGDAARFDDWELLANTWAHFGYELLARKELARAEEALLEAYRIRKLHRLPSLPGSYRNLGMLRLEQGDLRSASVLLDASIAESKSERGRVPQWRLYHARGRLRLAEGKLRQ